MSVCVCACVCVCGVCVCVCVCVCVLVVQLPYNRAIRLLGVYSEKDMSQKDTCTAMFTEAWSIIGKTWKQSKCPATEEWIKKKWYIYTVKYYLAI